MLKSTMSDNRILQPSAITIVPSVADVFFDLARNLNDCPTTFTFIRDKVPDPNFRLRGFRIDVVAFRKTDVGICSVKSTDVILSRMPDC